MSHEHQSPESTRRISYDRLRKEGIPKPAAKKIAEEVARRVHDNPGHTKG